MARRAAKYGTMRRDYGREESKARPTDDDGSGYTADEVEFMKAVEAWQRRTGNRFPTAADVLRIARSLGYRKTG